MLILQVSRMVARGPWCQSTAERTSGSSTASMTRSSRFSTTRRRRGSLVVSPTMGTLECLRVQSTPRGQSWPPVLESQTAKTTSPWGWRDPSAQVRLAALGLELGDQRLTRLTASTRIISEEDQKVSTSKVGDLEEIQVSGCPILQMRIICGAWQWWQYFSAKQSNISSFSVSRATRPSLPGVFRWSDIPTLSTTRATVRPSPGRRCSSHR